MSEKTLLPSMEQQKLRVDAFVSAELGVSKSQVQHWCAQGRVRHARSGKPVSKGDLVTEAGLRVNTEQTLKLDQVGVLAPFFENDDIFVVNKPAGLPTLPKNKHDLTSDCVAYRLAKRYRWAQEMAQKDYGLLHRLDNNTSGLLLAAKDVQTHDRLRQQWGSQVFKGYVCLMSPGIKEPLRVNAPLAHHGRSKEKMTVVGSQVPIRGEPAAATTFFAPSCEGGQALLAIAILETSGSRHQIRVHAAHMGYPLLGDVLYGGPALDLLAGQALHAACVRLPGSEPMICPIPAHFKAIGTQMGVDEEAFDRALHEISELSAK